MTSYGKYDESGTDYDAVNARVDKYKVLREGGQVRRFHTVPILGEARVDSHSFNMALLLMILMPDYPRQLLVAVLVHDLAERFVGDTPAFAKYGLNPDLGKALHAAEAVVEKELGLDITLTDFERQWLKGLDLLECYIFCCDQQQLGNNNVHSTIHNLDCVMREDWIPVPIREFYEGYRPARSFNVIDGEKMDRLKFEDVHDG